MSLDLLAPGANNLDLRLPSFSSKDSNSTTVKVLFSDNPLTHENLNERDCNGLCPIHYAVLEKCESVPLELVKLVEKGNFTADVTDTHGRTALIFAVLLNNTALVMFILSRLSSISPNVCDNFGYTALHYAIFLDNNAIVALILDSKIDLLTLNKGDSYLHFAIRLYRTNAAIMLLEHGHSVSCKDNLNRTPLHIACGYNLDEICKILVQRGADTECVDNVGLKPPEYITNNKSLAELFNQSDSVSEDIPWPDSDEEIKPEKIVLAPLDLPKSPRRVSFSEDENFDKISKLEKELESKNNELQRSQEEKNKALNDLHQVQKIVDEMTKNLETKNEKIAQVSKSADERKLQIELNAAQHQNTLLLVRINDYEQECNRLKKRAEDYETERTTAQKTTVQLSTLLEERRSEISRLKEEIAEISNQDAIIKRKMESFTQMENELKEFKLKENEFHVQLNVLKSENKRFLEKQDFSCSEEQKHIKNVATLEMDKHSLTVQVTALERALEKSKTELETVSAKFDSINERHQIAETSITKLRIERGNLTSENQDLMHENAKLQTRIEIAQEEHTQQASLVDRLKKEISDLQAEKSKKSQMYQEIENELHVSRSDVKRLELMVLKLRGEISQHEEHLEEARKKNEADAIEIKKLKESQKLLQENLENAQLMIQSNEKNLEMKNQENEFDKASLNSLRMAYESKCEEILQMRKIIDSTNASLTETRKERDLYQERLGNLKIQGKTAASLYDSVEKTKEAGKVALQKAAIETRELELKVNKLKQEKIDLERLVEISRTDYNKLSRELRDQSLDCDDTRKSSTNLKIKLSESCREYEKKIQILNSQLKAKDTELYQMRKEMDEFKLYASKNQRELELVTESSNAGLNRTQEWKEQQMMLHSANMQIAKLESQLETQQLKLTFKTDQIQELTDHESELKKKLFDFKTQISDTEKTNSDLQGRINALRREMAESENLILSLKTKLVKLESEEKPIISNGVVEKIQSLEEKLRGLLHQKNGGEQKTPSLAEAIKKLQAQNEMLDNRMEFMKEWSTQDYLLTLAAVQKAGGQRPDSEHGWDQVRSALLSCPLCSPLLQKWHYDHIMAIVAEMMSLNTCLDSSGSPQSPLTTALQILYAKRYRELYNAIQREDAILREDLRKIYSTEKRIDKPEETHKKRKRQESSFFEKSIPRKKKIQKSPEKQDPIPLKLKIDVPRRRNVSETTEKLKKSPVEDAQAKKQDSMQRAWKGLALTKWEGIANHRLGNTFMSLKSDVKVFEHMDLKTIRTRVREGVITSTDEFHRDMLLMAANVTMCSVPGSDTIKMAQEMANNFEQDMVDFRDAEHLAVSRLIQPQNEEVI